MARSNIQKPVEAPKLYAPTHGLLAAAEIVEDSSLEWENGVVFLPEGCQPIEAICIDCPPADKSELLACVDQVVFKPYVLEFGFEVPASNLDAMRASMTSQMLTGTSSKLESLIWNGCSIDDTNPLLSTGTSLNGGDTLDPISAVGGMMDALASPVDHIGGQGTIHMSALVAVHVADLLWEDEDGNLRTKFGKHLVVIGAYPSTFIAGHLGDIQVYLGEPFITEAPSEIMQRNKTAIRIERTALAAWNACTTFVQAVDVCAACGGGTIGS